MMTPQRICIPTDFSPLAEHAMRIAVELARTSGAQLHILHVFRTGDDVGQLYQHPDLMRDSPEVTRFLASLEATDSISSAAAVAEAVAEVDDPLAGVDVVRATRIGVPADEIVTYVKSHQIDLIVIASHGKTNWQQLFAGSVTTGVIQHAPCPVLVIPRGAIAAEASASKRAAPPA